MLRQINPQLSLHYWDWTQDPTAIPNANLGGGMTGTLNLFTSEFMGYGGSSVQPIGSPWQNAAAPWRSDGFYIPGASPNRDSSGGTAADPPASVNRSVVGSPLVASRETNAMGTGILDQADFAAMRLLMESAHDDMHNYVRMGGVHISFRDPFVFLLHSNVDRLYARWQTDPMHPERLDSNTVYGTESGDAGLNGNVEPWSTGHSIDTFGVSHFTRPWYAPENQGIPHTYKDPFIVFPPCYDTNHTAVPIVQVLNTGTPPVINFNDVPTGETAARAAVFRIFGCNDVTVRVKAGAGPATPFSVLFPASGEVTVSHSNNLFVERRIWLAYKAGPAGVPVPDGSVTFECPQSNKAFTFVLKANAISRPTVAVMLVLDQSGSMDWLAGVDATTKRIDILHTAATQFVQLVQDSSRVGDAVGMVSFDQSAYPGVGVTTNMGTGIDLLPVTTAIQNLHPQGATSIGNGVALGRNTLNPVTGFDQKAMVVFTDGLENTSLFIADVMGSINDRTFAIGLGTAQQVSVSALTALANNTGGRLLLSGPLGTAIDDAFRLSKFFIQVLAGVTNTNVVTDPSGYIAPGVKVRIPFVLNETDIDCTAILLVDLPAVRFLIETPAGNTMDPAQAAALGDTFAVGTNMSYYRFTLPLPLGGKPAHAGTWHAILVVDDKLWKRYTQGDRSAAGLATTLAQGIRYSFIAHAYSNLRMEANVSQNSFQPGAMLTVRASLSEYGIPVDHRASMRAELERPDHSGATLALTEVEPGIFETSAPAVIPGVYHFHLLASGATLRGQPFTREQWLSAAVVPGGDNPPPTSSPSTQGRDKQLCELLMCLLRPEVLGRFLSEHQVDPKAVQACIDKWCKERPAPPSEEELREREGTVGPTTPSRTPAAATFSNEQIALLAELIRKAQQ
jgi:hypothetical protein